MMNTNNEHTTNGGGAQDASLSRVLSSEEVAVKVSIHYRTVVRWANTRLIEVDGGGNGSAWKWSSKNLRDAGVLAALAREGFSSQDLAHMMTRLHNEHGSDPFGSADFVVLEKPKQRNQRRTDPQLVKVCTLTEAFEICKRGLAQLLLPFMFNYSKGVLTN